MHDTDYIEHHGILGMKWGRRRYQYEDGSLTEAGRKRYGVGEARRSLSDKIDEYRRRKLQAKVERETQKRVASQQKLKAAEAETDVKLQNERLKRLEAEEQSKAAVTKEQTKRLVAEEKLAAARADKKRATAEAEAADTKRQSKIDAIKDTIKQLRSEKSPETEAAKAQLKLVKTQEKAQLRTIKEQQKLQKAQVKEEIRKIKEQRKAEKQAKKEAKQAEQQKNQKQESLVGQRRFSSMEELYANRNSLSDAELKAARNRLEDENRIFDMLSSQRDKTAKARQAKIDSVKKTVVGALDFSVNNPELLSIGLDIGVNIADSAAHGKLQQNKGFMSFYNTASKILKDAVASKYSFAAQKVAMEDDAKQRAKEQREAEKKQKEE